MSAYPFGIVLQGQMDLAETIARYDPIEFYADELLGGACTAFLDTIGLANRGPELSSH